VRESIPEKASRLLATGAVYVQRADGTRVAALVHGDHGRYVVAFDGERWACSCPAWTKGCSHLAAVELVATPTREVAAA
jgi:uncharacterized Zn finger protein